MIAFVITRSCPFLWSALHFRLAMRPARAIETTPPGLVCDPFMGSGTTLRAAKDAGVPAIGIDTSERYCEMAVERLAQGSLFAFDEPTLPL